MKWIESTSSGIYSLLLLTVEVVVVTSFLLIAEVNGHFPVTNVESFLLNVTFSV